MEQKVLPRRWLLTLAVALLLFSAKPALPDACASVSPTDGAASVMIAAGTPAATPYYVCDSGVAGPTVVITGGVHGDEPAGACAAEQIRHWPIKRGKLVVLPRANVVALKAGKRLTPGEEPALNNLNRDFPKATDAGAAHGALALALWEFVRQQRPTWFLDLHEGRFFSGLTNSSVGSRVIVFPTPEGREAATAMSAAVNASITNSSLHFTFRVAVYDDAGTGGVGGMRVIEQIGRQPNACAFCVCD